MLVNNRVISEGKIISGILSIIYGNINILNKDNLVFINLDLIIDGTIVNIIPDLYNRSLIKDIDKWV